MKFYDFLNEAKSAKKENQEKIAKDCKLYLNLLSKHNIVEPFFRGISRSKSDEVFDMKTVRKNRVPKAMDKQVFEEINEMLEEEGYARRDRSVIATSHFEWTKIFGIPHMFFPIGKFKYTWVKSFDFNSLKGKSGISKNLESFLRGQYFDEDKGEIITFDDFSDEFIEDALEELKKYIFKNKGISVAHDKKYEIWFECDKYYVVRMGENDKADSQIYLKELMEML